MASDLTPNVELTPPSEPAPAVPNRFFFGPKGLRAGWRIPIFFAIVILLLMGLTAVVGAIKPLRHHLQQVSVDQRSGILTPVDTVIGEGVFAVLVVVAGAFMTLIDKRSFADYRLPWNLAFGKRFWQGALLGFAMLSVLLAAIWALHGFSLEGFAVSGPTAVKYGLLWAIAFLMTAVFEDFTFRGYLQSALGDGVGFWPAALILAVAFGGIHWSNHGEALFGCVSAGSFGLLEAFALWRTGNLWLLFGMHMSWDWGESYFYGTADSGVLASGHLLNSSFHGAQWLTGGTVGPEGSWLVFPTLLLGAVAIHFLFPSAKRAT